MPPVETVKTCAHYIINLTRWFDGTMQMDPSYYSELELIEMMEMYAQEMIKHIQLMKSEG